MDNTHLMLRIEKHHFFVLLLCLAGCTSFGRARNTHLPYDAWRIGFQAPPYMDVWLETADVEDIDGYYFPHAESGTVSIAFSSDPTGWNRHAGWGAGRDVTGAALPKRIYIRWQSLVEPKTYQTIVEIPEKARQLMRSKAVSTVPPYEYVYQRALPFELAPGGWVKAWVMSAGSIPVEVLCQKAEVEPKGPALGEHGGRYVTLATESREYMANHSVPYESWSCPSG